MILDALPLLEELKAIASLEFYDSKDIYDRGRYEPLLSVDNLHMI